MTVETTHVDQLDADQVEALQKAATGMLEAGDAATLEGLGLVQVNGDEVTLTEEGRATLRTLVDPKQPLT